MQPRRRIKPRSAPSGRSQSDRSPQSKRSQSVERPSDPRSPQSKPNRTRPGQSSQSDRWQPDFELSKYVPSKDCKYIAFYKPFAVISQFSSGYLSDKPTLCAFGFPAKVYPVGRLDSDSEGLLVLSDDARLNDALLNPKRGHSRTYLVQVERVPEESALEQLRNGVVLDDSPTLPARVELLDYEPGLPPREPPIRFRKTVPTAWILLTITEGRNRQVRRMTAAVGHPTLRLVRWAIGELTLAGITPGQWTKLSAAQLNELFSDVPPKLPSPQACGHPEPQAP